MNPFIIITEKHEENARQIIVDREEFENCPVTDCYDQYGQQIGHSDAGSTITLSTIIADELNEKFETDTWAKDSLVTAFDHSEEFDFLLEENSDHIDIETEEVEAYNYWDGNNWKSIIIKSEHNDNWITHEYEEAPEDIYDEYEASEEVKEGFGCKYYKSENYVFLVSQAQGSVGLAEIVPEEEAETVLA